MILIHVPKTWEKISFTSQNNSDNFPSHIEHLKYPSFTSEESLINPPSFSLGEVPGEPGQVMRQTSALSSSVGLRVWWRKAQSNGAPVIAYTLQAAPYTSDQLDGNRTFTTVYNSTGKYERGCGHEL